jgi:CBS domain-containing protein/sporulation protein YlmC with PRC-barrel domain
MAFLKPLADGDFIFFSELQGATVRDAGGRTLGRLTDIIVETTERYPPVRSIVVRNRKQKVPLEVPWKTLKLGASALVAEDPKAIKQMMPPPQNPDLTPPPIDIGRIALAADLLDKQIVDTSGAKLRRVNDLHMLMVEGRLYLVHVDVGFRGLVRRMGWERSIDGVVRRLRPKAPYLSADQLITWQHVQPMAPDPARVRLDIASEELGKIHPADLADILEELAAPSRQRLFEALTVETAADTLGEIEDTKVQAELLEHVGDEKAAAIIEAMHTDEAAGVLQELPEEKAAVILEEMHQEEATEVRRLLEYAEDTAGGHMSTDMITLPPDTRAEDALFKVREAAREVQFPYYVYVVTSGKKLVSVMSLREILLLEDGKTVGEGGTHDFVTVGPNEPLDNASEIAAKYDLLAVPVVDETGVILGIVTVDDLLARLMESRQ